MKAAKSHEPAPSETLSTKKGSTPEAGAFQQEYAPWSQIALRVQTKQTAGGADDPLEREADAVAEQVMQIQAPDVPNDGAPQGENPNPLLIRRMGTDSEENPQQTRFPHLRMQRMPNGGGSGATTVLDEPRAGMEEIGVRTLIVEDDETELASGQMTRSEFLGLARRTGCEAAESLLSRAGQSTDDCVYLNLVFSYLDRQDAPVIERLLRRFAPELRTASSAVAFLPVISERVRQSTREWLETGEISNLPEDLPPLSLLGIAQSVSGTAPGAQTLQAKAETGGARDSRSPESIRRQLGEGRSLGNDVAGRMGNAFGHDFSRVQIHTDRTAEELAAQVNARAFTVGGHVAFASGEYRPGTLDGDALIAHELAHVVQQRQASQLEPAHAKHDDRGDAALENDANRSVMGAVISLWNRGRTALGNFANDSRPRLQSGLQLQRCGRGERAELANEPQVFFTRQHYFHGDLFGVEFTWHPMEWSSGNTTHTLGVDVEYAGDGRADRPRIHGSKLLHNYVGPAPDPRMLESDEGHILVNVFADSAHTVEVEDNMYTHHRWSPPSHTHVFHMYFDNEEYESLTHNVEVLAPNAVPVPEGTEISQEQWESQTEEALASVDTGIRDINTLLAVAIAEVRFFKDDDEVGPSTIDAADLETWDQLLATLLAHQTELSQTSLLVEDEESLRNSIERLMQYLRLTRRVTGNLQVLRERSGYIEDIAEQADTLIQRVILPYHQATVLSLEQPDRAFPLLREAHQATMALPYNIASLYVRQGQGVYKFSRDVVQMRAQIEQARSLAGLNRGDRPIYEYLEIAEPGLPAWETAITDRAGELRRQLFEGWISGEHLLQQVMEHVQDSQHRLAIFAVLALLNQFRYFKHELNGITGDVLDVLGRDLEDVCDGYIVRLNEWVDRAEPAWAPTADRETRRSVMSGVASEFSTMVSGDQFTQDLQAIQDRLETIAVIEMVAQVVAIVAVSALVANVAGAAMAASLEGIGVGGATAWGLITFTEALAFTFTSRLGNELLLGGNQSSFAADLALNFVLFSYLKGANAVYTRILARLSRMEQLAIAAGRVAPSLRTAQLVGRSGITHGVYTFGALQAFAEVHYLVTHQEAMGGEERMRTMFTNATIVAVLGMGRHLQTRLTQRVQAPIRRFFLSRYVRQLEALEAERQSVVRLMAEVEGGNQGRASELAERIQMLNEAEVRMISHAEGAEGVTRTMLSAEMARYQQTLRDAESALAQSGMEMAGGQADLFRRLGEGSVAYREGGVEIARSFFEEQGGRFEAGDNGIFVGRLGAEVVTLVPEAIASRFGLMETARSRTADRAEAMGFVRDRLSSRARRGLEQSAREETPEETFERLVELERAGANVETHLEGLITEPAGGTASELARPGRPTAETDPATYLESVRAYLPQVSRGLPAETGVQIRAMEELGLRGDLRFQLIVRVLDPLFNSAARRAAMRAQRAADAETPGSSNLASEFNRIQTEMLRTSRDSEISVESKQQTLRDLISELETLITSDTHVTSTRHFRFGEARSAVDTLTPENFGDTLRVNSAGEVMRGERPMGNFRSLLQQVIDTNNSLADRGIQQEFVVAVGEPGRGGYRDIMIVSRPVSDPAQPRTESPIEPLPPGMEGGGIILDIGAGTSAFALEMVPEAARQGSMLVQTEYAPTSFDPGLLRADLGPHFNAIPRRDGRSVAVFGDPLQNMGLAYGPDSIRLMFINHVNAHYNGAEYISLARNLMSVMQEGGRVEVQWDTSPERPGGARGERGHIAGPELRTALEVVAGEAAREFTVNTGRDAITDYDYSIEPSRYRGGPRGNTDVVEPIPEHRWIFSFGARFVGPLLPTIPAPGAEGEEFEVPESLRRD